MSVHRYVDFFWNSKLTSEQVQEIQAWVNSLSDKEYGLLQLVVREAKDDVQWEIEYRHNL